MMDDGGVKKRRVRKGTHSCWECRRRKIRCHFTSPDDQVCTGCKTRGTPCTSQEFVDEHVRVPPERRLAQRLSRLEDMMEKLVERMLPAETEASQSASPAASSEVSRAESDAGRRVVTPDVDSHPHSHLHLGQAMELMRTAPPASALTSWNNAISLPTPLGSDRGSCIGGIGGGGGGSSAYPSSSKLAPLRKTLYDLFPSQHDAGIIFRSSPGNLFVVYLLYSNRDAAEGRAETIDEAARLPSPNAHPVMLARRLLQLTICLQHMPPDFDHGTLQANRPVMDLADEWTTAVSNLVCFNDDLIGCAEGLEVLLLQVFYQVNSGNLRKGWLNARRALSLAQLMGVDRRGATPLPSCETHSDPRRRPSAAYLWYRTNFIDRYLSMLLGLPCGSRENNFSAVPDDTALEKLEKMHTVISGRIIERNMSRADNAYAVTQAIDCELEQAAKSMGPDWWTLPAIDESTSGAEMMAQWMNLMLQLHHYSVLILLHLPYMLRDPSERRWDYSKRSCLFASREVLIRFIRFRSLNNKALSCRHVDYSALVAAMTLILGYLGRRPGTAGDAEMREREKDRMLVLAAKAKMEDLSSLNNDKLSGESADIVRQLLPIIDTGAAGASPSAQDALDKCLHLNIPYLGTININPTTNRPEPTARSPAVMTSGSTSLASSVPTPSTDFLSTPASASASTGSGSGSGLGASPFDSVGPLNPSMYLSLDPGIAGMEPSLNMDFDEGGGLHVQDVNVVNQGGFLDGDAYRGGSSSDGVSMPGLTADANDWLFQGVDTAYWSLLNGGFVQDNS